MEFNVLSLNLWHGGKLNGVFQFIESVGADVMCLQEAIDGGDPNMAPSFRTVEVLKEMYPDYYFFFTPEMKKMFDEGVYDIGNLVVSKYPIDSSDCWFFDKPYCDEGEDGMVDNIDYPSSFQHVRLDVNGNVLDVFNVHGIWGFDGDDNPRRQTMSEMIVEQIADKSLVVLAGDFNCNPNTQAVGAIQDQLVNVFDRMLITSFNVRHKISGGFATAVVDMVFVSPSMTIIERECSEVDVSDHFPLRVKLEI